MSTNLSPWDRRRLLTIPNMLTMLRLVMIPFFVAATLAEKFNLAFTIFVTAGITDIFDGMIARRLNQRSSIGAFLDPAADKLMMFSAYLLYTLIHSIPHRLPGWLTFTIFSRDVLLVFTAYLLYTRVNIRRFPPSIAGKASTVAQVTAVSAAIAANTALRGIAIPLLPFVFAVALSLTLLSGWDYVRRSRTMLEEM